MDCLLYQSPLVHSFFFTSFFECIGAFLPFFSGVHSSFFALFSPVHWIVGWRVAAASPALSARRRQLDFYLVQLGGRGCFQCSTVHHPVHQVQLLPLLHIPCSPAPTPAPTCAPSCAPSRAPGCAPARPTCINNVPAVRLEEGGDGELGHARGDQQPSCDRVQQIV